MIQTKWNKGKIFVQCRRWFKDWGFGATTNSSSFCHTSQAVCSVVAAKWMFWISSGVAKEFLGSISFVNDPPLSLYRSRYRSCRGTPLTQNWGQFECQQETQLARKFVEKNLFSSVHTSPETILTLKNHVSIHLGWFIWRVELKRINTHHDWIHFYNRWYMKFHASWYMIHSFQETSQHYCIRTLQEEKGRAFIRHTCTCNSI